MLPRLLVVLTVLAALVAGATVAHAQRYRVPRALIVRDANDKKVGQVLSLSDSGFAVVHVVVDRFFDRLIPGAGGTRPFYGASYDLCCADARCSDTRDRVWLA